MKTREVMKMQLRSVSNQPSESRSIPLIHWAAVSSGALIGAAVALVAGSLWAAAAFSSHNGAFYNHLAWWFGGTLIGAVVIGALIAGALSSTRGVTAGIVNGLSSWALIALAAAAIVAVTAIANGTTSTISLRNASVNVDLIRPYVAFWSAVAGLGAAAIGGVAGGLLPRRRIANSAGALVPAMATGFEAPPNSATGNRAPSRAAG
jgi:hypothetical protein